MRAALVVALLAVLIRLMPISDIERPLFSDERDYDRLARTLAATGRYDDEGRPTAYRPVGYPAMVAAIYCVAGPRPAAVRVVQAILDGATAFLLFLLLRRRGARTALGAAVLWAGFPPAILYTHFLRPETVASFLVVAIAVALSTESSLSRVGRILLGSLLGLAVPASGVLLVGVVEVCVGAQRAQEGGLVVGGAAHPAVHDALPGGDGITAFHHVIHAAIHPEEPVGPAAGAGVRLTGQHVVQRRVVQGVVHAGH